jgi:hypothetical protein
MGKIKVYLSASIEDKDSILKFIQNIEKAHKDKYEITCRWWDRIGNDKITYALECMNGVKEADLFLMYNGNKKTTGKSIELGMAIILGKIIRVYGNPLTTIFNSLIKYCGKELPKDLNDPPKYDFFLIDKEEPSFDNLFKEKPKNKTTE